MPNDAAQGGRRHFHRGRRGHDRRGPDRRGPQQQQNQPRQERQEPSRQPPPDQPRSGGDQVDVEQIMRDIRARIAQRHGIELTDQQVQELAARKLESILDPRTIKPSLLDQLRRGAGARPDSVAAADNAAAPYTFEDTTIYDSPSGLVRAIRTLLNPILKLFFNPNPLIQALHIQSRLNVAAVQREAQRDQQQAEWNALHYEILQRLVTEVSRVSLEIQSLALKVESLSAKVDFNERRVRHIEGAQHQARPTPAREPAPMPAPAAASTPASSEERSHPAITLAPDVGTTGAGDASRRRRRRRRGRRGGGAGEAFAATPVPAGAHAADGDDGDEEGEAEGSDAPPQVGGAGSAPVIVSPDHMLASPVTDAESHSEMAPQPAPAFVSASPEPVAAAEPDRGPGPGQPTHGAPEEPAPEPGPTDR